MCPTAQSRSSRHWRSATHSSQSSLRGGQCLEGTHVRQLGGAQRAPAGVGSERGPHASPRLGKVFRETERAALLPLPATRFANFREAQRTVHRDGHVEVERAYYSAPPEYVGRTEVLLKFAGKLTPQQTSTTERSRQVDWPPAGFASRFLHKPRARTFCRVRMVAVLWSLRLSWVASDPIYHDALSPIER